jgi:DMSO/TMAO reductase YedYZ molybdopterin-dependent catalytic subunit
MYTKGGGIYKPVSEPSRDIGEDTMNHLKLFPPMIGLTLVMLLLAACTAPTAIPPSATTTAVPSATFTSEPISPVTTRIVPTAATSPTRCALAPVVVPTRPAQTPKYTELDPTTGLHMTGTPQEIELASYRLKVTGKVDRPLNLTYDELRCMPRIEAEPVLICPGYFEDVATWAGAPLNDVLELAGIQAGATSISLLGADGYSAFVPLDKARSGDNFLAYEWEGKPVPILHGFPVRAVFPALQGNKWVKWLVEIQVD